MEPTIAGAPNPPMQVNNNQKPKGLVYGLFACAVLAIAGIAFGAYGMVQSSNKSNEIVELKTNLTTKDAKIAELESELTSLNTSNQETEVNKETTEDAATTETEVQTEETAKTAAIVLGDVIDENETRTVFKVGECTADGPSVKCSIKTKDGEALISVLTTDHILRLVIPKNQ